MASSSCFEDSTSEEDGTPRHCSCSDKCYTSICRCRCHRSKAVSPKRVVLRKLTDPLTGPCVSSASEEEDEVFDAAAPAQLLDLSIDIKPESSGEVQPKSAAQIFLKEKEEQLMAKMKMRAKLALLEKEVTLGQHLLHQTRMLLQSKEALLMRKVRVTYNKCHKFWRGKVVSAHKSLVDEQVDAAKARLRLSSSINQFNISDMIAKIDILAPDARYKSANPLPSHTSTSRPWVRKPRAPRSVLFAVPLPPVSFTKKTRRSPHSLARATPPLFKDLVEDSHQQLPAGYRGDLSIVAYGDPIAEEPSYDFSTQLEHSTEFFWDGKFDFSYYEEERDVNLCTSDIDCFDPEEVACHDAGEVSNCLDAEEVVCCDAEVVSCFDAEEVVSCSDLEVSSYDADEEDCGYYDDDCHGDEEEDYGYDAVDYPTC